MGLGGFISPAPCRRATTIPQAASRPFDKDRDGFVLSEGAGIVVLEELEHARKRGATIYAEVLGCGSTADAHHITAPHPERRRRRPWPCALALRDARLNPDDMQYINAHGTSTPLGDAAETKAIKQVFGAHARKLAISSTKSMLGHLLGASGGVELIACVLIDPARRRPPDDQLPDARPGLRSRLRAEHRPRNAGPPRHLQQLRLRRPQLLSGRRRDLN